MNGFTVEEINMMCIFGEQGRAEMIADIKNVLPHIQDDRDMAELVRQLLDKLEAISNEEFLKVVLEATK